MSSESEFNLTKEQVDLILKDINIAKTKLGKDHKIVELFDLACAKPTVDQIKERTEQARKYTEIANKSRNLIVDIICDHKFGDEGFWKSRLLLSGNIQVEMYADKGTAEGEPDIFYDDFQDLFLDINQIISHLLPDYNASAVFTGLFANMYMIRKKETIDFLESI